MVTDPPYGIDFGNFNRTNKTASGVRYKANKYHNGDWDKGFDLAPFMPIIDATSPHQIIWGGNYFPCLWNAPSKAIIFWHKHQPCKNFSAGELAWSSLDMPAKHFSFPYFGNIEGNSSATQKLHPTQKPVEIMLWCIEALPLGTQTIVDPFMGSGTTGVACVKLGRKFIGIEIEPKYYDIAKKRIQAALDAPDMFIKTPEKAVQSPFQFKAGE